MDVITHYSFKDGILYEQSFTEFEFEFAKAVRRGDKEAIKDLKVSELYARMSRYDKGHKRLLKLIKLMDEGASFTKEIVTRTSKEVEY